MTVALVVWAISMLAIIYIGFIRNIQVFNFRNECRDATSRQQRREIADGTATIESIDRAYAKLEEAPYFHMVVQFWRPLKREEWYTDSSFME